VRFDWGTEAGGSRRQIISI